MGGALQLTGICSVAVQVRDLERSLAFYRDVLGQCVGHREGRIAQFHGQGGARPARGRRACHSRRRWPWPRPGLLAGPARKRISIWPSTCPRTRACRAGAGGRTAAMASARATPTGPHLLLVWLDDVQLAGNRLPRVCTRTSEPDLADGRPDRAQPRAAVIARPCGRRRTEVRRRPVRQLDAPAAGCRVPRKTIMHRPQRRAAADAFPESARRC